jgi:hypothetical protein
MTRPHGEVMFPRGAGSSAVVAFAAEIEGLGAGIRVEADRISERLKTAASGAATGGHPVITEGQRSALERLNDAAKEYEPLVRLGVVVRRARGAQRPPVGPLRGSAAES